MDHEIVKIKIQLYQLENKIKKLERFERFKKILIEKNIPFKEKETDNFKKELISRLQWDNATYRGDSNCRCDEEVRQYAEKLLKDIESGNILGDR